MKEIKLIRTPNSRIPLMDKVEFDKLSKYEKRVLIAKDILERIKLALINPRMGHVIRKDAFTWCSTASAVQDKFNNETCHVCARGALLASWIGNFDSFTTKDIMKVEHCSTSKGFPLKLVRIFGLQLMRAIEYGFEQSYLFENAQDGWIKLSDEHAEAILNTFKGHVELRFETIFQNIIDNKGVLVAGKYTFGK